MMRYLSLLFVLLFFLGAKVPDFSFEKTQLKVHFISSAYAGQSASVSPESAAPSPKLQEKPHFGKIWKQKFKAMNPFKNLDDREVIALLLAFFVGSWGAHKFYLGDKKGGFTMLGITLSGIALYTVGYFFGIVSMIGQTSSDVPVGVVIAAGLFILGAILLTITSIWAFIDFIRLLIKMA